jgi:hypothetical protein
MKKFIFLGFLVVFIGCKSTISAENFSDADRVGTVMNYLASDALLGRDSGSEGIEKAANFIVQSFKDNKVSPFYESYLDTLTNYDKPSYNVVGFLEGNDPDLKDEYLLIGAHYDHIGIINAVSGDSIANGANDNATGTTTVLELARYFAKAKSNKRSLIFAFFSAEEKGLLGSVHLANKMKEDKVNLYAMLNYEMTGVPMVDKDYLVYVTGFNKSNMAEIGNKYAKENLIGFLPTAEKYNLFQRSDNYPFHEILEVPSQTFSTFDFTNFDHYHQVGDEPALMNFKHMAQLVNKMIPVVQGIANSEEKEISYK